MERHFYPFIPNLKTRWEIKQLNQWRDDGARRLQIGNGNLCANGRMSSICSREFPFDPRDPFAFCGQIEPKCLAKYGSFHERVNITGGE